MFIKLYLFEGRMKMKKIKIKMATNVDTVYTHTGSLSTKNEINKIITIFLLFIIFIILNTGKSKAVLQSNGGTVETKNIDDWIVQIRQMESLGGALGLSETINTTGLLATTDSNGLDCHMEKNTEYGALVILSASSYGNPNKIASGETTTGNATGVVMNINKEWVAAGAGLTNTTYAKNAKSRYINNDYGTTSGGKYHTGDTMNIGTWHRAGLLLGITARTTVDYFVHILVVFSRILATAASPAMLTALSFGLVVQ